jgi:hypothetical protein
VEIDEIYQNLKKQGLIGYGKIIPVELLENYWGKYEPPGSKHGWAWYGRWCTLKMLIEEDGFFLTSRDNKAGSLRIRRIDETPQVVDNRLATNRKRTERTANTLHKMDLSDLSDRDKAKMHNSLNKINNEIHQMSSILYDI